MRFLVNTAILSLALGVVAGPAVATTVLTSQPLKGGAGGLVCSCTNLMSDPVTIDVALRHQNGSSFCNNLPLSPSAFPVSCSLSSTLVRTCTVSRDDGGSLSSKQVLCTFSALDAAGNPTAVVPVDKKMRQ